MRTPKFETYIHAKEVGEQAVYVYPSCPHQTKIRGTLVSSKMRCRSCGFWEAKEKENDKKRSDKSI